LFAAVNIFRLQFKNRETIDAYAEKQKTEVYSKCGVDFLKCKLLVYIDTTDCKVYGFAIKFRNLKFRYNFNDRSKGKISGPAKDMGYVIKFQNASLPIFHILII
jgi:hypothetical protein